MICFPQKCTFDKFGGELVDILPSINFNNINATDLPAEASNRYRADLAGMTQTGFQCYIKLNMITGELIEYEPSWDKNKTDAPIIQLTRDGWVILFPFLYWDLRGNKVVTNLLAAESNLETYGYFSTVQRLDPTSFLICTFDNVGVPSPVSCNMDVFVF